jgi:hypothetical protein
LTRNRIVATLQVVSAALFAMGVVFIAAAILWPASDDALISASGVGAAAFGIPAGIAFVFAYWLAAHPKDHEHRDCDDE